MTFTAVALAGVIAAVTALTYPLLLPGQQRSGPTARMFCSFVGALLATAILAIASSPTWLLIAGQLFASMLGILAYHRLLIPWMARRGSSWE